MAASKIITISKKIPLFKGKVPAISVELVAFKEIENKVVTGLNHFKVGQRVLFIEPDYHIPNIELYHEYFAPGGDPSKSKLGNRGRIKAVKFNLHTGDDLPVYSYGIILEIDDVTLSKMDKLSSDELDQIFSVSKPMEKEENSLYRSNGNRGLPEGFYKTDEPNINNVIKNIDFPIRLIGTQKYDGSSITLYSKLDANGNRVNGICSRNVDLPLTKLEVVGTRRLNLIQKIKALLGKKYDMNIYEEWDNDNIFVKVGKIYLDTLVEYCTNNNLQLAVRGELCGKGSTGSGCKNNPYAEDIPFIQFYGVDTIKNGVTVKGDEFLITEVLENLNFVRCKKYFNRIFRYKKELLDYCEEIFQREKEKNGILIEGIVVKNVASTFSAKVMNLEYDSKK